MEQTPKRTDKHKRKSIGGFYSEFKHWNTKGKSSLDLKLMVTDIRQAVTHQLVRIRKLKYVIECYKQQDKTRELANQKLRMANKLLGRKSC